MFVKAGMFWRKSAMINFGRLWSLYVGIFLLNPDGVANIWTKFQLYGNFFVYIFQEV